MSRVFALNWRSFILVVCVAALPRTDATGKCRRCISELFNTAWDHFVFSGPKPPVTDNCYLKVDNPDKLPPDQQCEAEVCMDYYVYNSMGGSHDSNKYFHVRDCAENLLNTTISMPPGSPDKYCDSGLQLWCPGDETKWPFNIVCGDSLETYSALCTTKTDKEPACNNDYNFYSSCGKDPQTNPCRYCAPSGNDNECKNETVVKGKWCTKTTKSDKNGAIISVERGASATNAYSNEGNLTRTSVTIDALTYTIEYCKTPCCNSLTPCTDTSTTAVPTSTRPTEPSTAPSSSASESTPAPTTTTTTTLASSTTTTTLASSTTTTTLASSTTTTNLASSIVASALTVGVCAMLLTLFGR